MHLLLSKRGFSKWLGVLLLITMISVFLPVSQGQAAEVRDLKAYFDQLDARGGDWYRNYNNDSGFLAFREAYVMQSYLLMYERYKDTKYLDKFVLHADSVLNQRDSVRKVTDYRGLSLPAWRHTDPPNDSNPLILGGKYFHVAVDTGVISYPYAWFAQIVKSNPGLSKYNAKANIYVQAAKDAISVHEDEWRESGSSGYYIYRKGSPYWCDGVGVPFNQNLGLGRTMLKIYHATGETKYLDRVKKVAQHFKDNLTLQNDRYVWNYWWGYGYNGWTSSQKISTNTPSYSGYKKYEDFRHGAVDGDFVVMAYEAGIVFNETDIQRFANTVGKNILRSDGKVNETVSSVVLNGSNDILIGHWLRFNKWVPKLFDATYQRASSYTNVGAPGLLVVAYMNWAYGNTGDTGNPTTPPVEEPADPPAEEPTTPPPAGELVINGNFSQGRTGWSAGGSQASESNGNSFMLNDYNWQLYQDIRLSPGSYKINASVKKGTGTSARVVVFFLDSQGNRTLDKDIKHNITGSNWEAIKETTFTVPASAAATRIYLVSAIQGTTVGFDNISVQSVSNSGNPPEPEKDTTAPQVTINKPADGSYLESQTTVSASATDNKGVTGVGFEYAQDSSGPWTAVGSATRNSEDWTATWNTQGLADGNYYLRAIAVDEAGNKGTSEPVALKVDRTAPQISGINASADSFIPDGNNTVTVNYQLSEQARVTVAVTNGTTQIAILEKDVEKAAGPQKIVWNGKSNGSTVPAGEYNIEITASDVAGNQSAPAKQNITVLAPTPPPATGELLTNGDFSKGRTGWSAGGTQVSESNGNSYMTNVYNWQLYQDLSLKPGSYKVSASVKKGTGSEARLVVFFIDSKGNRTLGRDIRYTVKGSNWETIPEQTFEVPATAATTRFYLLSAYEGLTVGFDNISVKAAATEPKPVYNLVTNGDFSQNNLGWSSGGVITNESNGNIYATNSYNWQFYQDLTLTPGKQYKLSVQTKKGTAGTADARVVVAFIDAAGNRTVVYDFKYQHKGTGWETMPEQTITIPANAVKTRIYLLSNTTSGYHGFDNIILR
jgi:hypothetical protein